MREALAARARAARASFYPLWIGGRPVETDEQLTSIDPSDKERIVGIVAASAGVAEAARAVAAAQRGPGRRGVATPVEERAELLRARGRCMRRRRFELAAWEVVECGKEWREADADVCEAIDFCEFYARQAVRLQAERGVDVPGEENRFYTSAARRGGR